MSNNPFSKLAALRESLPEGAAPTSASNDDAPAQSAHARDAKAKKGPTRAVLRYERKGRGGKEVTLVEQLALDAAGLEAWCRDARKALGCGGSVEGGALVLAGDQRARLAAWLAARGVTQVRGG
jgi:translation initiation factor 1